MSRKMASQTHNTTVGIDVNTVSIDGAAHIIPEVLDPPTVTTPDGTEVITDPSVLDTFAMTYVKARSHNPPGVTSAFISLALRRDPGAVFMALRLLRDHGYVEESSTGDIYLYNPGENADELMYKSLCAKGDDLDREILIGFKDEETVVLDAKTVTSE